MWFDPESGCVIDHVAAGKRDKRGKLAEHKVYGHFDALAALVYMVRRVELQTNARPHPPAHIMMSFPEGATIIDRLPWQPKAPHELALEEAQKAAHGVGQRGRLRMFNGGKR